MKRLCLLVLCLLTAYSLRVKHQHGAKQTPDMDCSGDGTTDPDPEPESTEPTDREVYGKLSDSKKLGSPANGRTGTGCHAWTPAAHPTTAGYRLNMDQTLPSAMTRKATRM